MLTQASDDREAFTQYLDQRYGGGLNGHTLEEALAEFREYQRQLRQARAKVQEAIESSERGESRTIDESYMQQTFARLDAKNRCDRTGE